MTAPRRRSLVVTWAALSLHVLGIALGAAQVCFDREHTHGGLAAPDCAMHHESETDAAPARHSHHGAHPSDGKQTGDARISCRCPDGSSMYLGQMAILQPDQIPSPFVETLVLDLPSAARLGDPWSSPPSPPPR